MSAPSDLDRMKWTALGLLAAAAVLYVGATLLEPRHAAWGYAAAFGEAAMVGAIADWFAVVALFGHPLGLPIPHTAIIPANKDRIGRNLASFLCAHFLGTEQVLDKLRRFGAARRLADWLAERRHAEQLAGHASAVLRYALRSFDDERVRRFVGAALIEQLGRIDVARLGAQLIEVATAEGRHQAVLASVLRRLRAVLDDDDLKQRVAELIAAEVKVLRVVGLDELAGRYAAAKMLAGLIRLMGEMADDPAHPLRGKFDRYVGELAVRLQDDATLRARVEDVKHALLGHAPLAAFLQALWSDLVRAVERDLDAEASVLRSHTATAVMAVGERLRADEAMQDWIDQQLLDAAPRWVEQYREQIRLYIVTRVQAWNAGEMTQELERNIGRDLQFIRINGTLVGGLVGLAIHAATHLLKAT